MALVNPQIAMSYRPTTEYQPRNALAEYAQLQSIMGGQRQAEMADMQMEDLRRERDALGQIQAAIVAKGGPPDLGAAADAMIRTGRPQFVTQGMAIRESLKKQRYFEEFESRFGAGRAAPSAAAEAAGVAAPSVPAVAGSQVQGAGVSIADSQATLKQIPPKGTKDIFAGRLSEEEKQRIASDPNLKDFYEIFSLNAASFLNRPTNSHFYQQNVHLITEQAKRLNDLGIKVPGTLEEIRQVLGVRFPDPPDIVAPRDFAAGQQLANEIRRDYGEEAARAFNETGYLYTKNFPRLTPAAPAAQPPATANALAPAAALVTNAMVAPAAQPAVPPAGINQLAAAGAGPNIDDLMARYDLAAKAGHPMAPVILKQIEAALRADPSETRTMQQLGYPLTREGYADFRAAQMKTAAPVEPSELRTMDALGYPRTREGYAAFRAAQMRETQQQPPALVPILRDGKPVLVPREEAVGQTPFSPTAVQVLGMGPGREPSAQSPAAAQPRPLTAAQEAARRDKLGKEFKSATAALQTTQDVLDSISFVRAEPGLSRATGFTGTFLPSIPEGAAAAAETRLRNLEGKVTALGKAQAAATGAIGSIANQEWQILRDQIAAIDRTKGTGPLLKQLELVELQAQGAMARIRDAYQRQFGEDFERFPQFSNLPAPSSSFTPRAPAGGAGRAAPAAGGVDANNPLLR